MSDELSIRPVDADADSAALAAIYRPHVSDSAVSFELCAPDATEMAQRARSHLDRGLPWLVAYRGDQCVGYAYAGVFRSRAAYDGTLETSAYVAAPAQGQGVGRALYQALFAALRARGCRLAVSVITVPNPGSTDFHERLGFTPAGRLSGAGWKFDRAWDVAFYQRAITERDGAAAAKAP